MLCLQFNIMLKCSSLSRFTVLKSCSSQFHGYSHPSTDVSDLHACIHNCTEIGNICQYGCTLHYSLTEITHQSGLHIMPQGKSIPTPALIRYQTVEVKSQLYNVGSLHQQKLTCITLICFSIFFF